MSDDNQSNDIIYVGESTFQRALLLDLQTKTRRNIQKYRYADDAMNFLV